MLSISAPSGEADRRDMSRDRAAMEDDVQPIAVSVIVANYNGALYIAEALESALQQTLAALEIIVVDDGSTDDSVGIVQRIAARDSRVRLVQPSGRSGPGAARNQALVAALGRWVAVLDSDDIMHPERLETLIRRAEELGADIIADNQIVFDHEHVMASYPLLKPGQVPQGALDPAAFIHSNAFFSGGVPLGYLKPLIRRDMLARLPYNYDPQLFIAEDFDFILRLLLAGARFHVSRQLTYFYRRHGSSISHRLSEQTLAPMLAADDRLREWLTSRAVAPAIVSALDHRRRTILHALAFERLILTLKTRRWAEALRLALAQPTVGILLAIPACDRLKRGLARRRAATQPRPAGKRVSLLSRQRIVGSTNGSSAYLLSLCGALRRRGYEIDLISPSPAMFGRWPFLLLDPAMDIFARVRIRGAWQVGRIVVARNPMIALRATAGMLHSVLRRVGIRFDGLDRKAPHAIAVPLKDADRLFLATEARTSELIVADYAFLNEAIPFTLQPCVPSVVVMHDFFSDQDQARTVVNLDPASEAALLGKADAIVAIQQEEARKVKALLPGKPVLLAPMAVEPVARAQPGEDGSLLFVGSNTLPNLDGIQWFITMVWPQVLERFPKARLRVAGSCCGALGKTARNVELLGRVETLAPLYQQAGIVISPLRLGSGLKIKLIEALGYGKAVIATATTLQGIEALVSRSIIPADTAEGFTEGVAALLMDSMARAKLGTAALETARRHFGSEACYGALLDFTARGHLAGEPSTSLQHHITQGAAS